MKFRSRDHKWMAIAAAIFLSMLLIALGTGIFLAAFQRETEVVYQETEVEYGTLTVGMTKEGTAAVGTVTQEFALDISAYSGTVETGFSLAGPAGGNMPGSNSKDTGSGRRLLEVEEIYGKVGQYLEQGDPLLKLTVESVEDTRTELVSDQEEAKLQLDKLTIQQRSALQEASQAYEQNQVYGSAAPLEYEETVYTLQKAVEEAGEALERAREELAGFQTDLETVQKDYETAVVCLREATAAVEGETETYWYLKNEEVREQARRTAEEEEDEIQRLEEEIRETKEKILSLEAAYHEAELAYRDGEVDARTIYDKRMYAMKQAGELYSIATDQIGYQLQTAEEDYEDACEKLQAFDDYISDGVVCAAYSGVITEIEIEAGDTVQGGSRLVSLNQYDEITVHVTVEDEERESIAIGDTVPLMFSAFPEEAFTGAVSDIGEAVVGTDSVAYEVEIKVAGDVSGLYGGMTAEATFLTEAKENVLYVSRRAVLQEEGKSYVLQRDSEGNVIHKEVKTGFTDGRYVEIKEGLEEGEKVLTEGRGKQE